MNRNAWILLLILLCVAFLVSCQKKETADTDKAELVRIEAPGEYPGVFVHKCGPFREAAAL